MHQLVILTALTATSGLFGGQCQSGGCGGARMMGWCAPRTACASPYNRYVVGGYGYHYGYGRGYAAGCATCPTAAAPAAAPQSAAPAAAAPAPAPAPAPPAPPAPTTQYGTWRPQVARAGYYYYPSYYGYAASGTCPNGNCARR